MPIELNSIKKEYLILCEGRDTEEFLRYYLGSRALKSDPRFSNDIQILFFNGNDTLERFIQNLENMEHFDLVRRLLIIRDAENNVQKAENSVKKAFRTNNLPIPGECNEWVSDNDIATSYTLMPSCDKNPVTGALEDLCWEILKDQTNPGMKTDVQHFIDEIKEHYSTIRSHEHKSRLHSWLSIHDKYVSMKVGEAAKAGVFDWKNKKLHALKALIEMGFEE